MLLSLFVLISPTHNFSIDLTTITNLCWTLNLAFLNFCPMGLDDLWLHIYLTKFIKLWSRSQKSCMSNMKQSKHRRVWYCRINQWWLIYHKIFKQLNPHSTPHYMLTCWFKFQVSCVYWNISRCWWKNQNNKKEIVSGIGWLGISQISILLIPLFQVACCDKEEIHCTN